LLVSCDFKKQKQNSISPNESQMMTTLDTLLEACWNKKEISKLEMVMSENASRRVNNITVANNRKEVAANIAVFISGFPDLFITMSNLHMSSKYASYNWIFNGTNTGVFGEFPATGKKVKISGMSKVIFNEEGKIVMEEVTYNELDLLQQLGYSIEPPSLE
jgi:predicted ester cyclase